MTISGLPEDGLLVLHGLDLQWEVPSSEQVGVGLGISSCAGLVLVQDCRIRGRDLGGDAREGVLLSDSKAVAFVDCEVVGGHGFSWSHGRDALRAQATHLSVFGSSFVGGGGGYVECCFTSCDAGNGGDGFDLDSGTLWASHSTITGGEGGEGYCWSAGGGDGGVGLRASGSAHVRSCSLQGGVGGYGDAVSGWDGADWTGDVSLLARPVRRLELPGVLLPGERAPFTIHGLSGEHVFLALSEGGAARFLGPESGVLHVGEPAPGGRLDLGPIHAPSGALRWELRPPVPAFGEIELRIVQAALVESGGALTRTSDVRALLVLGEGLVP